MTGEVNLFGKVMPIGGVREKFLAAKRAGIKKVLLPFDNKDDYEEIPEEVKKGVEIRFIKLVDEIFEEVFIDD